VGRTLLLIATVALAATLTGSARQIVRDDPRGAALETAGQPAYVQVDDMLLLPEQLDEGTRNRAQANVIDYRQRLGAWDAGVIPFQIAAAFTATERARILDRLALWERVAPVRFVARTTQSAFLDITRDDATAMQASPCFSGVGQPRRAVVVRTNLGGTCAQSNHTVAHELGHALGLFHEHQRADRDSYVSIDFSNVQENARSNFNLSSTVPLVGEYDFGSVMHYQRNAFAIDASKPVLIPLPPFEQWATRMGTLPDPSDTDHNAIAFLYDQQLRESTIRTATETVRTRFDRADFLLAMERLHAFYMSRYGLQRAEGLSIAGRPDFPGIATWIFDIYLGARSGGFTTEGAFDIVVAAITRTEEWAQKNPGRTPLTPATFRPVVSFSRDEFLDALNQLDRFYAAPEGLQRPEGLSISGGPDFLGIATWIFDVYLNQRLAGASPTAAWVVTSNAIRATDEWRRKH
jgi:astacin (peptidase family M12A)